MRATFPGSLISWVLCHKSFLKLGTTYVPAHCPESGWFSATPRKHLLLAPFSRAKADAWSKPLWPLTWQEDGYISEEIIPEDKNTCQILKGWLLRYPHWKTEKYYYFRISIQEPFGTPQQLDTTTLNLWNEAIAFGSPKTVQVLNLQV